MEYSKDAGLVESRVLPFSSAHSSILKVVTWSQLISHSLRKYAAQRYIPIGPTGRMMASFLPSSRVSLICFAISWPIRVSKSEREAHSTGLKLSFQKSSLATPFSQQASIFAISHPLG